MSRPSMVLAGLGGAALATVRCGLGTLALVAALATTASATPPTPPDPTDAVAAPDPGATASDGSGSGTTTGDGAVPVNDGPAYASISPRWQSLEADLGSGVIGVGYERQLGPRLSVRATFQLQKPWYMQYVGGTETDAIGFGGELRPWLLFRGDGPAGLYVSPFVRLAGARAQDAQAMATTGFAWSAGLTAGYGWVFADGKILLRVGAGIQYWGWQLDSGAGYDGLAPDIDGIVGYVF